MNGERTQQCCLLPPRWFWLGLAAMFPLSGCAKQVPPGQPISGTVQVEQQPLSHGLVIFIPQSGTKGPRITAVVREGQFALPAETGPWPGAFRVEVNATPPELCALSEGKGLRDVLATEARAFREIHPDFNTHSKLLAQVQPGQSNTYQFHVRWSLAE